MEISKQNYLNHLNKNQKEAVINIDGPYLIVAGAGSGKTKVLTSRIAHIIKKKKEYPNQILRPLNILSPPQKINCSDLLSSVLLIAP